MVWDADWGALDRTARHCNLVITTEQSVCGGNVVLCPITLTICAVFFFCIVWYYIFTGHFLLQFGSVYIL